MMRRNFGSFLPTKLPQFISISGMSSFNSLLQVMPQHPNWAKVSFAILKQDFSSFLTIRVTDLTVCFGIVILLHLPTSLKL